MKKQLLLLFVMILLPMVASADDSGKCGENLTWKYETASKTLTISGTGAMTDYSFESSPWYSYRKNILNLVLNDGITSIGNNAFGYCEGLTSVTIPNSVTYIGDHAFSGCTGLTSITIPNSVISIYDAAFQGCTGLTSIDIPNSVTSIGNNAFRLCTDLTSINIPNQLTRLRNGIFQGCKGLTSLVLPSNVEFVYYEAFNGCELQSIVCRCPSAVLNYTTGHGGITDANSSFSPATYCHAILYVPEGKRWEAIYGSGGWYKFINIRETAMDANNLSPEKAYTMMNAKSYGYSVYDAVNNEVKTIQDFHNVDEDVANNSWQIVKKDGANYLYNIGAKKYAKPTNNGTWQISETPTALNLTSDDDGKITINGLDSQWYFVVNDKMNVDKSITAIDAITEVTNDNHQYYTLDGKQIESPRKGVNIIRTTNGKTKKVVVK